MEKPILITMATVFAIVLLVILITMSAQRDAERQKREFERQENEWRERAFIEGKPYIPQPKPLAY